MIILATKTMIKSKKPRNRVLPKKIETHDRVRLTNAYGMAKNLTGTVEQICEMTGFLYVRVDKYLDNPEYRHYLHGPCIKSDLTFIEKGKKPEPPKRVRIRIQKEDAC